MTSADDGGGGSKYARWIPSPSPAGSRDSMMPSIVGSLKVDVDIAALLGQDAADALLDRTAESSERVIPQSSRTQAHAYPNTKSSHASISTAHKAATWLPIARSASSGPAAASPLDLFPSVEDASSDSDPSSSSPSVAAPAPSAPVPLPIPAETLEPEEAWKGRLRYQIERSMQGMVDEVRAEYESRLASVASSSSSTSPFSATHASQRAAAKAEYDAAMANIVRSAQSQFDLALERERQERRWAAGGEVDAEWQAHLVAEQQAIRDLIARENQGPQAGKEEQTRAGGSGAKPGPSRTFQRPHDKVPWSSNSAIRARTLSNPDPRALDGLLRAPPAQLSSSSSGARGTDLWMPGGMPSEPMTTRRPASAQPAAPVSKPPSNSNIKGMWGHDVIYEHNEDSEQSDEGESESELSEPFPGDMSEGQSDAYAGKRPLARPQVEDEKQWRRADVPSRSQTAAQYSRNGFVPSSAGGRPPLVAPTPSRISSTAQGRQQQSLLSASRPIPTPSGKPSPSPLPGMGTSPYSGALHSPAPRRSVAPGAPAFNANSAQQPTPGPGNSASSSFPRKTPSMEQQPRWIPQGRPTSRSRAGSYGNAGNPSPSPGGGDPRLYAHDPAVTENRPGSGTPGARPWIRGQGLGAKSTNAMHQTNRSSSRSGRGPSARPADGEDDGYDGALGDIMELEFVRELEWREQQVKQKEEELRTLETELRRKVEAAKRWEEDARIREENARLGEEEVKRKQAELKQREEDLGRREAMALQQEEYRLLEEENRRRAAEMQERERKRMQDSMSPAPPPRSTSAMASASMTASAPWSTFSPTSSSSTAAATRAVTSPPPRADATGLAGTSSPPPTQGARSRGGSASSARKSAWSTWTSQPSTLNRTTTPMLPTAPTNRTYTSSPSWNKAGTSRAYSHATTPTPQPTANAMSGR
ncbi:hypothetical protein PUNSTDRAFT_143709 [Punctularia strigosozonata HHB-11173 SS5]|uniref:uncharacterized protein n=1 Tax=Punctularia strigosozonata (strain HHB-11173) TaxID=741275 RepID=UPI0004416D19|nr:uncharacterized protein PUNSTDRAFT_143709 [Punctularia strigosozonata HHB-11173 SS5]EIN09110.1 hypothetical protein PUNSTDRAFT_143709 [Punctularia strigosozonata HHB-11173 SS5]